MNDDDFEAKLRALTGVLQRPDPTREWKAEILARARRDSEIRAPRWLLRSLGAAWIVSAILHFATPDTATARSQASLAATPDSSPSHLLDTPDTPLRALIALQSNPEFPEIP